MYLRRMARKAMVRTMVVGEGSSEGGEDCYGERRVRSEVLHVQNSDISSSEEVISRVLAASRLLWKFLKMSRYNVDRTSRLGEI
jgi:hypothetical protein